MKLPWKEITRLKKPQLTEIAIAKGLEPTWYLAPECLTKRGYYNHFKACKYVNEFEPKAIASIAPDEVLVPDEEVIEVTEQEYNILTGLIDCYDKVVESRGVVKELIKESEKMREDNAKFFEWSRKEDEKINEDLKRLGLYDEIEEGLEEYLRENGFEELI